MTWIQWTTGDGESQNIWIKLAVWIHQGFSHCQIVTIISNFRVQCYETLSMKKKSQEIEKKVRFGARYDVQNKFQRHEKSFHDDVKPKDKGYSLIWQNLCCPLRTDIESAFFQPLATERLPKQSRDLLIRCSASSCFPFDGGQGDRSTGLTQRHNTNTK